VAVSIILRITELRTTYALVKTTNDHSDKAFYRDQVW
jgi:hypothetical protein